MNVWESSLFPCEAVAKWSRADAVRFLSVVKAVSGRHEMFPEDSELYGGRNVGGEGKIDQ